MGSMSGAGITVLALIRREFVTSLRRVRAFVLLCAVVLMASLVVLVNWPGVATSPTQIAMDSVSLILYFNFFLLFAIPAIVPAYGATALTSERDQQTYEVLSLTLIPSWGIIAGKIVNAMGTYVLLLAVSAPIIATQFALPGIDTYTLWKTLMLLLAVAFSSAAVSVCASVLVRQTRGALLMAYLAVACNMGLGFLTVFSILQVVFRRVMPWGLNQVTGIAVITAPVFAVSTIEGGGNTLTVARLALAVLFQGTIGLLALIVAASLLRRRHFGATFPDTVPTPRTARERFMRIWRGSVPKYGPMPDTVNPVYLREVRHSLPTRRSARRRVFWAGLLVSSLLMGPLGWYTGMGEDHDVFVGLMAGNFVLVGVIACGLGASSITSDHERNTLELLVMTGLAPRHIVVGKMLAVLRAALPLALGVWGGVALMTTIFPVKGLRFTHLMVTLVALLLEAGLAASLSILASALVRRTSVATVVSYALAAWFLILVFPALGIFDELIGHAFGQMTEWLVCCLSPVLSFYWSLQAGRGWGNPLAEGWVRHVLANVLVILLILAVTTRVFQRNVRKGLHGTA